MVVIKRKLWTKMLVQTIFFTQDEVLLGTDRKISARSLTLVIFAAVCAV